MIDEANRALAQTFGRDALTFVASPFNLTNQPEWNPPRANEQWEYSFAHTFGRAKEEYPEFSKDLKSLEKKIGEQTGVAQGIERQWQGDLGQLTHAVAYSADSSYEIGKNLPLAQQVKE